jgi:hypothetical protein
MSPNKSRMDLDNIVETKPHLMPKPSPRKMVREISDSPEKENHRRMSSIDKSLLV